ncbi:hypothetical protein JTB14_002114 [Gonioctena quinquepunctata]|nr:hypothetical protein JTB14_002114 [Gonioctena quinquepunctata]
MAIISSTWIFEKDGGIYCHWPAYFKSDILKDKAIQTHIQVIEEKCIVCAIKVKYSTDDFSKASRKLQHLEIDSQTESESEKKRVPKKNTVYKDYDDQFISEDSNDNIPTVPLPKNKTFTPLKNVDTGISLRMKKSIGSRCGTPKNSQRFDDDGSESLDETNTISSKTSCESASIRSCNSCQENKALITETLRQLQIVKEDVNYLIRLTKSNEIKVPVPKEFVQIQNFNELIQLNDSLNEDTSFTETCNKFQCIGGKDTSDTTRRILNRLMTNELAVITNWTGRNNKNGFKDMKNIINLIHVSVKIIH